MAKQLTFSYNEKDYTLEFTKASVKEMERRGFVASDITVKPMTVLPDLFAGAFIAHHRFIKPELVDEIFNAMGNKEELIGKLAEMYNDPIESLLSEPESGKNVGWTANW